MYFEVNVSRNGYHLFATSPRSIQTVSTLRDTYAEIHKRFPESENFKVTVTEWKQEGQGIDMAGFEDPKWSP